MPPTHTRTFRVRHYECDANGHLSNPNYLRYMQETAFDASAAVGYSKERYEGMGLIWLARESEIEFSVPLHYNDTVEVKTWVGDFRRVRSRRFYEFRRAGTDDIVARGSTDWVLLEMDSHRPVAVPEEMIAAFAPDEDVELAPRRERFPEPPPPAPGTFRMRRKPEWRDIDTVNHINNAAYLDYMTDLGVHTGLAFGWSHDRMKDEGFAIVVRNLRIEYLQPGLLDDEIELATWVSNVKRSTTTRHYTFTRVRDGEMLARIRSLWFCIDTTSVRPIRFPAHFLEDLAANITTE